MRQSLYPKVFITPEGNKLPVKKMAKALAYIRANPNVEHTGWNWFKTPGWMILKEFRRGRNERINMRAGLRNT